MASERIVHKDSTKKSERLELQITSIKLLNKVADGYCVEYQHFKRGAKPKVRIEGNVVIIDMIKMDSINERY